VHKCDLKIVSKSIFGTAKKGNKNHAKKLVFGSGISTTEENEEFAKEIVENKETIADEGEDDANEPMEVPSIAVSQRIKKKLSESDKYYEAASEVNYGSLSLKSM
jgi:hypothetical protein